MLPCSWDELAHLPLNLSFACPALQFVEWSKAVCDKLIAQGHWADYIDPCSGLPVSCSLHTCLRCPDHFIRPLLHAATDACWSAMAVQRQRRAVCHAPCVPYSFQGLSQCCHGPGQLGPGCQAASGALSCPWPLPPGADDQPERQQRVW
jgi:hypothetical protein